MFSTNFSITSRVASMAIIVILALSLHMDTFRYKAIFVGLLFSHFLYGLYYSKNNALQLKQMKLALVLAVSILLTGLYFSFFRVTVAPYFLVFHAALSDAYLLNIKSRRTDAEPQKIVRTLLYASCFGLLILPLSTAWIIGLSMIGTACLVAVVLLTEDKKSLALFEVPLLAIVIYAKLHAITFDVSVLGFYHILTWYVFSFWMLAIKEEDLKKTSIFFGQIVGSSAVFVLLFGFLNLSITDVSFAKIIAFWSILHISTTLFLSKFNPRFVKRIFYAKI